jgi:thiol-disulfide isomerase/thioredoxin
LVTSGSAYKFHETNIEKWTASYCNTCRTISPLLHQLIESGVGEEEGGVSFCEIEYDSQDIMDSGFGMRYMITAMPTLLSFDRGEAITQTKLVDPSRMRDTEFMKEWIRTEAKRRGDGSGGSGFSGGGGLFGGLFGNSK